MIAAVLIGAAVVAIVVRAHKQSAGNKRRAEYRRKAEDRARSRRTQYLR